MEFQIKLQLVPQQESSNTLIAHPSVHPVELFTSPSGKTRVTWVLVPYAGG